VNELDVTTANGGNKPVYAVNPLDVDITAFSKDIKRRTVNKDTLVQWVKDNLTDGVDFGSIVFGKRVSRPSLLKPGSEKICGLLGLTPTFPSLPIYENKIIHGKDIDDIVIRCELVNSDGHFVAEGVGGRSVSKEKGDLNKALKMALKSAQIDATLRVAGLSDMYTQDIEDMPEMFKDSVTTFEWSEGSRLELIGFGKYKENAWADVPNDYIQFFIDKGEKEDVKQFCIQEQEYRSAESRREQAIGDEQKTNGGKSSDENEMEEIRTPTMVAIEKMKTHDKVSLVYVNSVNRWLYDKNKTPTEEEGQKVIAKMEGMGVEKPDDRPVTDLFEQEPEPEPEPEPEKKEEYVEPVHYIHSPKGMIECAMENWGMNQPLAVVTLNDNIPKNIMGKAKTIDNFTTTKCEDVIKGILSGSITPF